MEELDLLVEVDKVLCVDADRKFGGGADGLRAVDCCWFSGQALGVLAAAVREQTHLLGVLHERMLVVFEDAVGPVTIDWPLCVCC